jgi:hypothetical protein
MDDFFTFPYVKNKYKTSRSSLHERSYPLMIDDDKLSFAFIEIGCKHNGKRGQLKHKKDYFSDFWKDEYSHHKNFWSPDIFRLLSHYNAVHYLPRTHNEYSVDRVIHHKAIDSNLLNELSIKEKKSLRDSCGKRKDQDLVWDFLENNNGDGLYHLITKPHKHRELGTLRGKVAEYLSQKIVHSILDDDMVVYDSKNMKYFNEKFDRGTEIDQILQFYGAEPYKLFLDRLSKVPTIDLIPDTPEHFKDRLKSA